MSHRKSRKRHRAQARKDLRLLKHLGAGGSLHRAVKEEWVPVPLSRKMCHLFLQSPSRLRFLEALRQIGPIFDWIEVQRREVGDVRTRASALLRRAPLAPLAPSGFPG